MAALLLMLAEIGLRAADYGVDYTPFVTLSTQFKNLLTLNPDLPKKFFSKSVAVPSPIKDSFYKIKKKDSYRIFILGGSSAAGYPYIPNVSFGGFLKRKLEVLYPSRNFEVVNLGVSAVNSFFMRDIIDAVLDQKPDLILIYAGHNEYYGALGTASNDIAAFSPTGASFILTLRELKIWQLLSDLISEVALLFSDGSGASSKTLMEAMVGENTVLNDSDEYTTGIDNFRSNLDYILAECRDSGVPVILGELTSNLMQAPLQNIISEVNAANDSYGRGIEAIKAGDTIQAGKSLVEAKDLDALRFRAPSEMNDIIFSKADEYEFHVVRVDSLFRFHSVNGIPGYNLFTDHLHPNIGGYKMIADLYVDEITARKNIDAPVSNVDNERMETYLAGELPFTDLDSSYASIQLEVLLNSYPFRRNSNVVGILNGIKLKSISDSLAMAIVANRITWEEAHKQLAEFYFSRKNYNSFYREMNVLIEAEPYNENLYRYAADKLFSSQEFTVAGRALVKLHKRIPGAYSSKMLGIVSYESGSYSRAVNFLNQSLKYSTDDPETYFRLSAAYYQIKEYDKALQNIKNCLKLDPDFPNADKIYGSLTSQAEKKK